ncbi:MAG: hypothetical protein J6A77_01500 [Lachnospiraceae bacterium]|nr:hypothetical protein [Lachnospiraceae bacterium]
MSKENNQENAFEYAYSAKKQKEIEEIKKKYLPKEEDKMETLRRLDQSAEKKGTICSVILGVIGTLLFGAGMSLTMVGAPAGMAVGIVIGVLGLAILAPAYPLYTKVTEKQRKKIAPQIIALTEELLKEKAFE